MAIDSERSFGNQLTVDSCGCIRLWRGFALRAVGEDVSLDGFLSVRCTKQTVDSDSLDYSIAIDRH